MPPVRLKILRLYPAECQEQHREDQKGLKGADQTAQKRSGVMHRLRHYMIQKINGCSRHHRDGKHPILYCLFDVHNHKYYANIHLYLVELLTNP